MQNSCHKVNLVLFIVALIHIKASFMLLNPKIIKVFCELKILQ